MTIYKKDAKHVKNNACKRILTNREAIEQKPTSMDRESIQDLSTRQKVQTRRKRGSIHSNLSKGIKKLSRCAKTVFQRREKHRHECNQTCYSTKDPNNILSSQKHLSSRKMSSIQIQNTHTHTHTHTHNKSNQFLKNKSRQFSKYTLTHVFLVIAKSHCTCTCIKNSKEYYVLFVRNIARLHKCLHVIMIKDMRKLL